MHTRSPFGILSALLLLGCPTGNEPDAVAPLEGSSACSDGDSAPSWTFAFAASGPVDEAGAEVRIFTEAVPDEFGYSLRFEGASGTARADFAATVDGTEVGAQPFPGNVPFACEESGDVQVMFCALNSLTRDDRCWACEGDAGAPLPPDAEAWMSCDAS